MGINVGQATLRAVEMQIESARPVEALRAYERLLSQGLRQPEARRQIGFLLVELILDALKNRKGFDLSEYARRLSELPSGAIASS